MKSITIFKKGLMMCAIIGLTTLSSFAQSPEKLSYQAVVREGSGELITSGTVRLRFSVKSGSASGSTVYQESQTVTPNNMGLVTATIGSGTVAIGTFSSIDWAGASHFLKVEMDPNGGTLYTALGTTQLLSVPYALEAKHAASATTAGHAATADALTGGDPTSLELRWNGGVPFIDFSNDPASDFDARLILSNDDRLFFEGADVSMMGKVGIGTTSPQAPLEVVGYEYTYLAGRYYLEEAGVGPRYGSSELVSIRADQGILSERGFYATSDERYKHIEGRSDIADDLAMINKIQVTDYKYIDVVNQGNATQKGFIAQEVEQLIPEAIVKTSDYVPNIYTMAERVDKSANGDKIIVMDGPHELKEGDEVQLIADKRYDCMINRLIDANTFEVCGLPENTEEVFVYGKKVDDAYAVNYDRVFVSGIGAIQELSRLVDELRTENASLKADNATFKAELNTIKEHLGIDIQAQR